MSQKPNSGVLLSRIRAVIGTVDLDCTCREKLDLALERFEMLEQRRQMRTLIVDARQQAERIGALLELLRDLDEIQIEEGDHSVFEELALMFETIEAAAATGARDMRSFGEVRPTGPRPA